MPNWLSPTERSPEIINPMKYATKKTADEYHKILFFVLELDPLSLILKIAKNKKRPSAIFPNLVDIGKAMANKKAL